MGSFISNIHIRDAEVGAVTQAVRRCGMAPAYLSAGAGSWISVYPNEADQKDARLASIAAEISRTTAAPTFVFMVHDSDIFLYWLFDHGELIDSYNSNPGYFDGAAHAPEGGRPELIAPLCVDGVTPETLALILRPPGLETLSSSPPGRADLEEKIRQTMARTDLTEADLAVLTSLIGEWKLSAKTDSPSLGAENNGDDEPFYTFAEDQLAEFAAWLGISSAAASASFRYVQQGDNDGLSLLLVNADDVLPLTPRN
jgi:hypothetical protein